MMFSRKKLSRNRDRAARNTNKSAFLKYIADDLFNRVVFLSQDFSNILDIGSRDGDLAFHLQEKYRNANITVTDISRKMLANIRLTNVNKILLDEENLDFVGHNFDLITYSMGLHFINDVQNFLLRVKSALIPDGLFVVNFIGAGSFAALRNRFIEIEHRNNRPHFPHVSSFIRLDDVVNLLKQAGFAEIILDHEKIELEYVSCLELLKSIKNIGESSILINNHPYTISKNMLHLLSDNINFIDHINLISFIASPSKGSIILNPTMSSF